MAVATYTGNADQLFRVLSQIQSRMQELQKLPATVHIRAQLEKGTLTSLRGNVVKGAEIIGKGVSIPVKVKVANVAASVRAVREAFSKNITAKVSPYVTSASLKGLKDRIGKVLGSSTVDVSLRFQTGAAGKFRDTLRRLLAVLSRGSYVEAELRFKNTQKAFAGIKSKSVMLDVEVKPGTAAKIKALLELLKTLRTGVKIPVKLDIDAGLAALLKTVAKDLKSAADQAARLDSRVGRVTTGARGLASAGAGVESRFARIGQIFAGFASSYIVMHALTRTFTALKDALFDFPAKLQQIQVGFERMLGSKARADDMMSGLKQFAIPTPFETQDLAPLATQALAFKLVDKKDVNATKEVVSLIKDLGDAAFGLGRGQDGVNHLMIALGQMKVGTRVTAREMMQLQHVGVNAWQYLAEATGKSTREVRALVSKGLVPADGAIKAIRAGLRADFGGGMEKASKTMLGAISQIKDALRVQLSEKFAPQFEQLSNFVVHLAQVISANDFGKKLDGVSGVALGAIDRIGQAYRLLSDLYQHNSGVMNLAIAGVVASLLILSATSKAGPLGAMFSLGSMMGVLSERTDGVGRAAKVLQPVLYALAAAYIAVKVAAAQAAVSQGIEAAMTVSTAELAGLAAVARGATNGLRGLSLGFSLFKASVSQFGALATLQTMLAGVTESVSVLALSALPLLVGALGVAAIGYEKYQEKAARVDAANAGLAASVKDVQSAFTSLSQVSAIAPGSAEAVAKLTAAYKALDGSVQSLQNFKASALPQAQQSVAFNAKLKPLERAVLQDELARVQREIDGQLEAAKFKVEVEAQANPLSLHNLVEAFSQTYGQLADLWYSLYLKPYVEMGKWGFGQVKYAAVVSYQGIKSGFVALKVGLADAWYSLTGGFDSSFNKMLRGIADGVTGLVGTLIQKLTGAWTAFQRWYSGQSANAGEEDGPSLPGFGAAYAADQKKRNAAWHKAHPTSKSGGGLSSDADPYGDPGTGGHQPTPIIALDTAAKRRAALLASQTPSGAAIPYLDLADEDPKKKKGRTDAEKVADKERTAALKQQKDALSDSARAYDLQAKAVENQAKAVEASAKAQIEALTGVRDTIRDVFSSVQDEFVKLGIIDDPLGPMLRGFERLIDLGGQSAKIVGRARGQFDALQNRAQGLRGQGNAARSQGERLSGLDGVVPGAGGALVGGGGSGAVGSARSLFEHFNLKSTVDMTCADVASRTVEALGIAVKKSVNAGQLERNVRAAHWMRVDPRTAPQGALVFKDSPSARSGVHAMMSLGEGELASSSRHRISYFRARGTERAYVPSGGPGMSLGLGGATGAGGESPPAFGLSAIDGTLSKIAAVDKAWGAAVKSSEGNTARFALQSKLATREFQDSLAKAAAQTGRTVPQMVAWLRTLANAADSRLNRARAIDAVTESLRDLQKQRRAIGQEGNPLSGVLSEFEAGGKFAAAPDRQTSMLDAQMRLATAQTAQATKEAARAENLKTAALKAAAPFLTAATAGTGTYARALENATRRVGLWQDAQIQGNLLAAKTYDALGGAALRAAAKLRANPFVAAPGAAARLAATGQGLKGRAAGIRAGVSATVNARDAGQIGADAADQSAKRAAESLEADFAAKQDAYLADAERRITRNQALNDRQKQIDIARLNWIHAKDLELRKGGLYTDAKSNVTDILATRAEAQRQASGVDFSKSFKDDDAKAFTASTDDAAKALALFGDQSILAATKYDIERGALSTLTDVQRAQMLVQQAATAGLQRYGQEFDALLAQQAQLRDDLTSQRNGGPRSPLDEQNAKWKQEDAALAAHLIDLTDAQRAAYDAERPKVEALRESVRGLLADQKRASDAKFFQDFGKKTEDAGVYSPEEQRRSRIEDEARSAGISDADIQKQMPRMVQLDKLREYREKVGTVVSGVRDDLAQMFADVQEKGVGAITGLFDSIAKRLQNLAAQILADKVFSYIAGALGGLLGGGRTSAVPSPYSTGISLHRGGAAAPSFALGLKRVPYDGFTARLHAGESILTRRETAMRESLAASSGGNRVAQSSGGRVGDVLNVHGDIIMPRGTDANNFNRNVKGEVAPKLSRRSQQNLAFDRVTPGGRQR